MPIPRYIDSDGTKYDIFLVCPKCGWAIAKDTITCHWQNCPLCEKEGRPPSRLITRRYSY
jgi:hypothetical protein